MKDEDQSADQRDDAADHRDDDAGGRDRDATQRDRAGDERDLAAGKRDRTASERDHIAEERDHTAEERDHVAERSETPSIEGIAAEALMRSIRARQEAAADRVRAARDRRAGAGERSRAESDRDLSQTDRGSGANERIQARGDRRRALADRGASAQDREESSMDGLTGVYGRRAGFIELEREIAKARRTMHSLVVAFVDVDHLKAINDERGHAAGDRMLVEVAHALGTSLRSYDLIVRYGGDEFLCAISDLDPVAATERFALVNRTLAQSPEHGSVSVGLASLQPHDSTQDLIARADAALYNTRNHHRDS